MITNTLLSLTLPGEEYKVIKNKLQSTVLCKEELRDLDNLTIQDGEARFELPFLGDEMLKKMFGNISEVGIEVIKNHYFLVSSKPSQL